MSQSLTDMSSRTSDTKSLSIARKITLKLLYVLSQITIEPIVLISSLARSMTKTITQNLIQKRICEQFYHGSKENCSDYTEAFNGTNIADDIQRDASDYTMYQDFIQLLPAIIVVIMTAPWSDRHGRKAMIMLPLAGGAVTTICTGVMAKLDTTTPQDILLTMIPLSVSGGQSMLSLSCFTYFSDMTAESDRTVRVAIMDGLWTVGNALGSLIGGHIFGSFGYAPVYISSATFEILLLVYVGFHIKNIRPDKLTTKVGHDLESESEVILLPSSSENAVVIYLKSILDNVRICFKRRDGYFRVLIFLLLLCDVMHTFTDGESQLVFLYTRKMYNWNVEKYSDYKTSVIVTCSIGMFILMPILSKTFRIRDSILGLFSICSMFLANVIKVFSYYTPILLWIGSSTNVITVFSMVVDRAMLSKCVPSNELGKLLAVNSFVTTISRVTAYTAYAQVYKLTLDTFTGAIFAFSAVLTLPTLFIYCFICYVTKKNANENSTM